MGSVPRDLPHIKADGKRIINSDHILKITEVPKSMLVIGAGAVGCEFASIFARFGSKVTHRRVHAAAPPDRGRGDREGVHPHLQEEGHRGLHRRQGGDGRSRRERREGASSVEGKQQTIDVEVVLSATGRAPVTEDCGLEKTKVKLGARLRPGRRYMRTAEPNVYAIGDIVPRPPWPTGLGGGHPGGGAHRRDRSPRRINYDHMPNARTATRRSPRSG